MNFNVEARIVCLMNGLFQKNIALLITATANAVAVAEHVIYMMLSVSKSINQYDNEVRSGNFKKNHDSLELHLHFGHKKLWPTVILFNEKHFDK